MKALTGLTFDRKAVPTALATAHTAAVKSDQGTRSKYDVVYDSYYATGYRSSHLGKHLESNASVATGDSEKVDNPLYECIFDIGVRGLSARLQGLAFMPSADAKDLPKPDKLDRERARRVGRDAVANTLKALDRRQAKEEAEEVKAKRRSENEYLGKWLDRIDPQKQDK